MKVYLNFLMFEYMQISLTSAELSAHYFCTL